MQAVDISIYKCGIAVIIFVKKTLMHVTLTLELDDWKGFKEAAPTDYKGPEKTIRVWRKGDLGYLVAGKLAKMLPGVIWKLV